VFHPEQLKHLNAYTNIIAHKDGRRGGEQDIRELMNNDAENDYDKITAYPWENIMPYCGKAWL